MSRNDSNVGIESEGDTETSVVTLDAADADASIAGAEPESDIETPDNPFQGLPQSDNYGGYDDSINYGEEEAEEQRVLDITHFWLAERYPNGRLNYKNIRIACEDELFDKERWQKREYYTSQVSGFERLAMSWRTTPCRKCLQIVRAQRNSEQ